MSFKTMADFGSPDEDLSVVEDLKTDHDIGLFIMRNSLRLFCKDERVVLPNELLTKTLFFNGLQYKKHTTTKASVVCDNQKGQKIKNYATILHGCETIILAEYTLPCDTVIENFLLKCDLHLMHVSPSASWSVRSNPTMTFIRLCIPSKD